MSEQQRWAVMCSMTGYWGVVRPEHAYREDDGLLACTEWESLHDTWTEAMQYADRMSRTREVVLPRDPHRRATPVGISRERLDHSPSSGWYGPIYSEYATIYRLHGGMEITIPDGQLEDVALALLAHARKEKHRG